MSTITNIAKPITSILNTARVFSGETWSSITSTWATESRTWAATVSLFSDTTKPSTTITNVAKPA